MPILYMPCFSLAYAFAYAIYSTWIFLSFLYLNYPSMSISNVTCILVHFLTPSGTNPIIFLNLHNIIERNSLKSNSNNNWHIKPFTKWFHILALLSLMYNHFCFTVRQLRLREVKWLTWGRTLLELNLKLMTSNPMFFLPNNAIL